MPKSQLKKPTTIPQDPRSIELNPSADILREFWDICEAGLYDCKQCKFVCMYVVRIRTNAE